MSDFRKQIEEDIKEYKEKNPNVKNIDKPEWAFNYWILDKLFSEDEELIEEKIIDYNDKGIDCYVWHEDLHDLYLIQNKYYSDNSNISNEYVQNDFLTRSIGALEKGTYSRSKELQDIFNKYSEEKDFMVHFNLYVTNNSCKIKQIMDGIAEFNQNHDNYVANIFSLDDIEELYFNEPITNKKSMTYDIKTINKGTVLNVNTEAYKMTQALDAKYILTPVTVIYDMVKRAKRGDYPLFDANIREYLGATGNVNKGIMETLKNPKDRINFFYYNNGITIIADDIGTMEQKGKYQTYKISNPQIVNGCQTVSTIYETLSGLPESTLEEKFVDTYVMAKILKIPNRDESLKVLYKNIVTYNNSQNAINQKTFVASASEFKRLQDEFERRGLLICIKQSDKHKYAENYKKPTTLLNRNSSFVSKFGLKNLEKTKDFYIDLEKLLQVILAFSMGAPSAIQKKSKLLKPGSEENNTVVSFIKDTSVTINDLINLYLLYLRAEQEKKASSSGKMPIPLYLINCFSHFECDNNPEKISEYLKDSNAINNIIKLYSGTITGYYTQWKTNNPDKEYNTMIKSSLDMTLMKNQRDTAKAMLGYI